MGLIRVSAAFDYKEKLSARGFRYNPALRSYDKYVARKEIFSEEKALKVSVLGLSAGAARPKNIDVFDDVNASVIYQDTARSQRLKGAE